MKYHKSHKSVYQRYEFKVKLYGLWDQRNSKKNKIN